MYISKIVISVLLTSLVLTACGGGGGGSSSPPVIVPPVLTAPATLSVSASTNAAVISDQVTLTWTGTNVSNCAVSGSTSNPSVATSGTLVVVPSVVGKNTYTVTCGTTTASTSVQVIPTAIQIPDPNFQVALNSMGYTVTSGQMDGHIALTIKKLIISDQPYDTTSTNSTTLGYSYYQTVALNTRVMNSKGLESFVNLTNLRLENQQVNSIDLTALSELVTLSLWGNPITTIDLSKNAALTDLGLSETSLSTVDISALVNLVNLDIQNSETQTVPYTTINGTVVTGFGSIDVSKNTKLVNVYLFNNTLTTINLTTNPSVATLDCDAASATYLCSLTTIIDPLWTSTNHPSTVEVPASVVFN